MTAAEPADNAVARARRAALPADNDFDIATLVQLPPFWGWVDGRTDEQVSFRMLLGGNDDGVALRFFWNGHYERTTLNLWTKLARRSSLALDIGAHTGVYTLAARAASADVHVLSFEPHWANFARLLLNLRANGFATTDAYMLAVGRADGILPFTVMTDADYLTTGGAIGAAGGGLTSEVRAVALDSFLPEAVVGEIDLAKLDVEGYESACLEGMAGILEKRRPTLFLECIDARAGAAVCDRLRPLGYRFLEIDDHTGDVQEAAALVPATRADGMPLPHRRNRLAVARPSDLTEIGLR